MPTVCVSPERNWLVRWQGVERMRQVAVAQRPTVRLFVVCEDAGLNAPASGDLSAGWWELKSCLHTVWMPPGMKRGFGAEELTVFAQITAPSTDQDAYLPLHRGAAAVYNSTTQSFMDEYGNWIYLTPMLLGAIATVLAAGWKFLGIGNPSTSEGPLDSLYAMGRRIRKVLTEAELLHIENQIDEILKVQREKSADGDESAVDDATLNVAAHRLESLIHDRRATLGKRPLLAPAA